jgi:hypothetical protein
MIVRTRKGRELVERAIEKGAIELSDSDPKEYVNAQKAGILQKKLISEMMDPAGGKSCIPLTYRVICTPLKGAMSINRKIGSCRTGRRMIRILPEMIFRAGRFAMKLYSHFLAGRLVKHA